MKFGPRVCVCCWAAAANHFFSEQIERQTTVAALSFWLSKQKHKRYGGVDASELPFFHKRCKNQLDERIETINRSFVPTTTVDQIYYQDLKISKILKSLFFKKFKSKIYITLIWNNVTLWRSISPSACVVDYQHAYIYDGEDEYMNNGRPPKVKSANDVVAFVHGDRYKHIFNDCSMYLMILSLVSQARQSIRGVFLDFLLTI